MNIGFVTIYAHRPHVAQMVYLSSLVEQVGHRVRFLVCDSAVPACHNLLLKGTTRLKECPRCIAGGLRSFPVGPVTALRRTDRGGLDSERLIELTASSAYRLELTESPSDLVDPAIAVHQAALGPGVEIAYGGTSAWIRRERLGAVFLYNGRMDLTRGVLEACRDNRVPFLAVETPWTGHGIALTPNNMCLATGEADRIVAEFREAPLLMHQAQEAAQILARRFLRKNNLEWRVYNVGARSVEWPVGGTGPRVLILPSSRNEVEGHPDWACDWNDYTVAFDGVMERLGIDPRGCLLRCHPNWAQRFGRRSGWRSEHHYAEWSTRKGIKRIGSADSTDTYALLRAADLVLVNGSTAGLEAAALGLRVLSVGHSYYQRAGFSVQAHTWAGLDGITRAEWPRPDEIRRRALRYVYSYSRRMTQFVDFVRAESSTRRRFYTGADPARLMRILDEGRLSSDDPQIAPDKCAEDWVLEMLTGERWAAMAEWSTWAPPGEVTPIRRRVGFRWLDAARDRMPVGDLM